MVGALGHTCRPSSVIHLLESLGPWYTISEPWSPAQKISNDLTFLVRTRGFLAPHRVPGVKTLGNHSGTLVRSPHRSGVGLSGVDDAATVMPVTVSLLVEHAVE